MYEIMIKDINTTISKLLEEEVQNELAKMNMVIINKIEPKTFDVKNLCETKH